MERGKTGQARLFCLVVFVSFVFAFAIPSQAQTVTASLSGQVFDASGGAIPNATVTAVNSATGLARTATTSESGEYLLPALPVGDYRVSAERAGFRRDEKTVTLQIGQVATLHFTLQVGEVTQKAVVSATAEVQEPTRTQVSTVITERQIGNLPVNGRQFIDFALLAPAVQIGDTTSGSTDVIVEPVTKLSFAGQNIHFNFIAVDGADDISTASGIQRATPPQESVREFRVINTNFTTEFGRAVGGIVNIITKSGSNEWHGTAYEYFRNNKLDAKSILAAPGLNTLRQNQFGAAIGGPIQKDRTWVYANYEGQRRGESPFYNSIVLNNLPAINATKEALLPALGRAADEDLNVLRVGDIDNGFLRVDHNFSDRHYLFVRYFITDSRLLNQSPLNDGFDLPSAFKDNFTRDQSIVGSLTSTFSARYVNEVRLQFARRSFDFPTVTTEPHLEVLNTFTGGVNRGNPDFYREHRVELVDNFTVNRAKHSISLGGNYNFVRTTESFPLFYPFEAQFANLRAFLGTDSVGFPHPFVIFFERLQASSNFTEPTIDPAVYRGQKVPTNVRDQSEGTLDHTYNGFFIQDKWRATSRLTVNGGIRYEFETWPSGVLDTQGNNVDPRVGLAYNVGTKRNVVVRAGFGLFHGIIPAPLLMCQRPSCGGVLGPYTALPNHGDALNAATRLWAFASGNAGVMNTALTSLIQGIPSDTTHGHYPDSVPASFCPNGFLSSCGFFGDAVIVRFDKDHQNPYGVQGSLSLEFEPLPETAMSISYLHVHGVHLGSFYNINQPDPTALVPAFDSSGRQGLKKNYFFNIPGVGIVPGTRDPRFGVYFEAASRWNSVFDGLLLNVQKRLSHRFAYGISYTYSKTIDDGPNPSFVLIPQDTNDFRSERAASADDVRHRFVANATIASPKEWNLLLRDFQFGMILTLQSPQRFTKFAGSDVNGDVFGNNDRVGIEPRNTFKGDSLQTVDVRLGRVFPVREKMNLEFIAEAFNLLNTVNVRFFNTAYGAADFCNFDPSAQGCAGATQFFREGSPLSSYGTPRAVFNPRQLQFALRFSF